MNNRGSIYSCDLAAYSTSQRTGTYRRNIRSMRKTEVVFTSRSSYTCKNRSGYLLEALDDRISVLKGLGLAAKVTGDGLPELLVLLYK